MKISEKEILLQNFLRLLRWSDCRNLNKIFIFIVPELVILLDVVEWALRIKFSVENYSLKFIYLLTVVFNLPNGFFEINFKNF
jgi:hypothetical protein